ADSFTAVFTANDGVAATGSISLTGAYTDAAGNTGGGGSDTVAIDTLNPTATVNVVDSTLSEGDNSSVVTIEFSEAVSGFTASDLSATNATLSDFTQVDGDSYTAVFTANDGIEATGSVSLTGAYTDAAGNAGGGGSDS